MVRKLSLVARTRFYWALSGDPMAVFERVADIDSIEHPAAEALSPAETSVQ
jgi:phytoene synthase